MPDIATVFQRPLVGVESSYGTAVSATKQLQSLSMSIAPKIETKRNQPAGSKLATTQTPGKDWTNATFGGAPVFDELIYPWASVLSTPTITLLGSKTSKYVFSMNNFAADNPKSFSIQQGSAERAAKASGCLVNEWGYTINRTTWTQSGSGFGQLYNDGITLDTIASPVNAVKTLSITGNPTGGTFTATVPGFSATAGIPYNATPAQTQAAFEAVVGVGNVYVTGTALPAGSQVVTFVGALGAQAIGTITANNAGLTGGTSPTAAFANTTAGTAGGFLPQVVCAPNQVSVYFASTQAGLSSASPQTRLFEVSPKISGRYGPIWDLNAANPSFAGFVETDPKIDLKFKVEADAIGMGFLNYVRNGNTLFMRTEAVGPVIESSYTYLFRHDQALKVSDISPPSDFGGVKAVDYTCEGIYDAGWGKGIEITIQNTTASL